MANHLDTCLLRNAVGLDQQIEPRHILTRYQPINLQQSSKIGRPNYRRSRGESYNSRSSARDELYNMTHVMQREVIPSLLDPLTFLIYVHLTKTLLIIFFSIHKEVRCFTSRLRYLVVNCARLCSATPSRTIALYHVTWCNL